jgi:hypothetical protein
MPLFNWFSLRRAGAAAAMASIALIGAGRVSAEPTLIPPAPKAKATATVPAPLPEEPVTPEKVALGTKIAGTAVDLIEPVIQSAFDKKIPPEQLAQLGDRGPGLRDAARDAVLDTLHEKRDEIASILGHALAKRMTLAELKAGARYVESPEARIVFEYYIQRANDEHLEKSAAVVKAEALLQSTPAGRRFSSKFSSEALFKDAEVDFISAVVPSLCLHLADRLDAEEARHAEAAKAAGAPQPSPEAVALGEKVVHGVLGLIDDKTWDVLDKLMTTRLQEAMAKDKDVKIPPEWAVALVQATIDTFRKDGPAIERLGGRALAEIYSTEELQAISDFVNGPAPRYFVKTLLAKVQGGTPEPQPAEVTAALEKFKSSGMADRLAEKLKDQEKLKAVGMDFGIGVAVIWLREFGHRTEAIETARRAARGW